MSSGSRPAALLFDPRDPAVLAELVEARQLSHHAPLCVKTLGPRCRPLGRHRRATRPGREPLQKELGR
jgi:hypothetical protein